MNRSLHALPLALALVSCGDKPDRAPANDRRGAAGDVLGGTIDDAMLPLDTVTSQSPPLRESPTPGASGSPAQDSATDDAVETPDAEPSPEPAPDDGA
jgi:hypothetical protein